MALPLPSSSGPSTGSDGYTDIFLLLVGCSVFITCILAWKLWHQSLIPSVKGGRFGLDNIERYYADPIGFVRRASAQYGDVFKVDMLFSTTIWLRGARLNKEYLETREDIWSFGGGMGKFLNPIVTPGYWPNLKTFVGSLSRGINRLDTMKQFQDHILAETNSALSNWREKDNIELFDSVSRLVHGIIVRCLMGPDFYEHHADELYHLLHEMEANLGSVWNFLLPHWFPHTAAKRLWAARDRIQAIIEERVQDRAHNPEKWSHSKDYVSYTIRDSATSHLQNMYGGHHAIIMFAAHTSTVSLIAWSIVELLRNPEHLITLRSSLSRPHDPQSTVLLDAIVKETIRRYCAMADVRLSERPKTLQSLVADDHTIQSDSMVKRMLSKLSLVTSSPEIAIPVGYVVSVSPYLTHHDPNLFNAPNTWNPNRWVDDPTLLKKLNNGDQIGFMPFGGGSHRCPGEKMASLVASTVIATLITNCDMAFVDKDPQFGREVLDFSKIGSPWLIGDIKVKIKRRAACREEEDHRLTSGERWLK